MRERLWDMQREAYGEVIAGMSEGAHICGKIIFLIDGVSPKFWPEEAVRALIDRWDESAKAARQRFAKDRLILPPDIVDLYEAFRAGMRDLDDRSDISVERLRQAKATIEDYQKKIEIAARSALAAGR